MLRSRLAFWRTSRRALSTVGDLEILEHDPSEASGHFDQDAVLPNLTNAGDPSREVRGEAA
jgi:hypothetical protein